MTKEEIQQAILDLEFVRTMCSASNKYYSRIIVKKKVENALKVIKELQEEDNNNTLDEFYDQIDRYFKSKPKSWWHWTTVLRDLWNIKESMEVE